MARPSKRERKRQAKERAAQKQRAAEAGQQRAAVRRDMVVPSDPGHGTSPASLGAVKAASEEARLVTCPDCGRSGGKHFRICPRADG